MESVSCVYLRPDMLRSQMKKKHAHSNASISKSCVACPRTSLSENEAQSVAHGLIFLERQRGRRVEGRGLGDWDSVVTYAPRGPRRRGIRPHPRRVEIGGHVEVRPEERERSENRRRKD